jgi:hypothetical protein
MDGGAQNLSVRIDSLIPDRVLEFTAISVEPEAIWVYYQITPALPEEDPDQQPWLMWEWDGVDDTGTAYLPAGGAFGPAEDGGSTRGDLTLTPAPPPAARQLRLHLHPYLWGGDDLGSADVELPLPTGS